MNDFESTKQFYNSLFDFVMPDAVVGNKRMGFLLYEFEKEGIVQAEGFKPSKGGVKV